MKNMKFLQLLSGENCRLKILICMKMKKIQECLGILEFNIQKGYSLFVSVVMLKNKECEEKKNGKLKIKETDIGSCR